MLPGLYLPASALSGPFVPGSTPHLIVREIPGVGGRPVRGIVNGTPGSIAAPAAATLEAGSARFNVRGTGVNAKLVSSITEYVRVAPLADPDRVPWGTYSSTSGDLHLQLSLYEAGGLAFPQVRHRKPAQAARPPPGGDIKVFTGARAVDVWGGAPAAALCPVLDGERCECAAGVVHFVAGVRNLVVLETRDAQRTMVVLDLIDAVDRPPSSRGLDESKEDVPQGARLGAGLFRGLCTAPVKGHAGVGVALALRDARGRRKGLVADMQWWSTASAGGGVWKRCFAAVDEAVVARSAAGAATFEPAPAVGGVPPFVGGDGDQEDMHVIVMAVDADRVVWLENDEDHRVVAVLTRVNEQQGSLPSGQLEDAEAGAALVVANAGSALSVSVTAAGVNSDAAPASNVTRAGFSVADTPGRFYASLAPATLHAALVCPRGLGAAGAMSAPLVFRRATVGATGHP